MSRQKLSLLSTDTYLLTPWCRVLLEKLTGLQLVNKFPAFHGTRRFITVLTSVHHLSLSWANPIQSTYPHPTSWRSILILSTHLSLGLPSGLFPSGFPTKTLYVPLSSPIRARCPAYIHTYIHTYTHTHTYIYIYIYTHTYISTIYNHIAHVFSVRVVNFILSKFYSYWAHKNGYS